LGNRGDMRPRLAAPDDVAALWENLAYIDIFATDHAPHTLAEKGFGSDAEQAPANPPPGVPGVQTMLPLLLTAVHRGKLSLEDVVVRLLTNPQRIYGIPSQPDTWIEVDVDSPFTLTDGAQRTAVGWTPFEGREVVGRVEEVWLRNQLVYEQGTLLAKPGSGHVLFQ
jgi:carbamoyl-phosphate synthase/aspartate carbamoyltransferase/dihydroorotase